MEISRLGVMAGESLVIRHDMFSSPGIFTALPSEEIKG